LLSRFVACALSGYDVGQRNITIRSAMRSGLIVVSFAGAASESLLYMFQHTETRL
jgi:hypothetical protein